MPSRAEKYMREVLKGKKVTTGKLIRLAVERHFSDLKRSRSRRWPYYFSPERAASAIEAFEFQRLALGEKTDEPFVLMPWQAWILYLAYGWRRKDNDRRRFAKVYIKVARGNAKTEFLAGVGNLGFFFEGERDPQIFWLATKKEQARIGWGRQKTMAERLRRDFPEIAQICDTSVSRIYEKPGYGVGFVTYLGKDSKSEDGFSPFYGLVDEYHAHPDNSMIHVIESGMAKRSSPMTWIITTAGVNPAGPCAQFEGVCKQVLQGALINDELLAVIYDLDEGDDWKDERVWHKANPSLGISVHLPALRSEFLKATTEGVSKEINFKTKNLNIWCESSSPWIPNELWMSERNTAPFHLDELTGRICFGGLDLGSNSDLTSLCLLFPPEEHGEPFHAVWWYWCPEEHTQEHTMQVSYLQWSHDGHITLTPGNVTDYRYIEKTILELRGQFEIASIAHDRWNSSELIINLTEEGVTLSKFGQGFSSMSTPTKELTRQIMLGNVRHNSNPVTKWMVSNAVVVTDPKSTADNIKLVKDPKKPKQKIDGAVTLVMAYGEYLTWLSENNGPLANPGSDLMILR